MKTALAERMWTQQHFGVTAESDHSQDNIKSMQCQYINRLQLLFILLNIPRITNVAN